LNLKQVNIKSHSDEVVQLTLKANGEKELTAGDIENNSDVEIVNPGQKIMTLTDKAASIEMTLWVRPGRGYETVESREEMDLEVNAISIDSIFTPIRQVAYKVDSVRVGDRTDFDKITMRVETNGGVSVSDALKESSKILASHFTLMSEFDSMSNSSEEEVVSEGEEDVQSAEDLAKEEEKAE